MALRRINSFLFFQESSVYLDDSGDAGKSKTSTKHYLWGILTKNPKRIKRCMKKSRQLCAKEMGKNVPELKYPLPEFVYEGALKCLIKPDFSFHYAMMIKNDYSILHKPNILSQSFIFSLMSKIVTKTKDEKIFVEIDKTPNNDFNTFRKRIMDKFPIIEDIQEKDSKESDGVQAAHLIANSVFKKYEHGQNEFYNIYKHKIETSIKNPKIKL